MTIKVTVPNSSGDYLTFGSGNTPTAAQIGGYDDGSSNGHMEFYTTASGTSTEQVRITSAGNVGIGTSSPSGKLHAKGGNNNSLFIDNDGSQYTSTYIKNNGTTKAGWYWDNTSSLWYYDNQTAGASNVYNCGSSGYHAWNQNGSEKARIDTSGNLLVGTTSVPFGGNSVSGICIQNESNVGRIRIAKTFSGNADAVNFYYAGTYLGGITYNNSAVAYNTTSDYRLKENVQPMVGALEKVAALKPVTYTWKADGAAGEGFIAHELQEVCPQAVTWEKDAVEEDGTPKYQGIDTSFLVATLTAAIQELSAKNDALEARLTALENK